MLLLVHARQLKLIEKKEHRTCPNSLFLFVCGSFTLNGPLFFCLRCLSLSGSHIYFSIPSAEEWRRKEKRNEPKPSRQMQTIVATSASRGDCFPLALSLYTWPTEMMFICDFFFSSFVEHVRLLFHSTSRMGTFFSFVVFCICLLSIHERPGFDDGFFFCCCVSPLPCLNGVIVDENENESAHIHTNKQTNEQKKICSTSSRLPAHFVFRDKGQP